MASGTVLGVSAVRPSFLVDVPAADSRKGEGRRRARLVVTILDNLAIDALRFVLEDAPDDDDYDDEDADFEDDDEDEDADDEDEDDEDVETWQVSNLPCVP